MNKQKLFVILTIIALGIIALVSKSLLDSKRIKYNPKQLGYEAVYYCPKSSIETLNVFERNLSKAKTSLDSQMESATKDPKWQSCVINDCTHNTREDEEKCVFTCAKVVGLEDDLAGIMLYRQDYQDSLKRLCK